jgi:hypothetical protein
LTNAIFRLHYNNSVKINFDAIESRLKTLVESSAHLVSGPQAQISFPAQLAAAVEAYLMAENIVDLDEFPKSLLMEVPTISVSDWQEFPVIETIQNLLQDAGLTGGFLPKIDIAGNEDLLMNEIVLRKGIPNRVLLDKTAAMPALAPQEENFLGEIIPVDAFIIVNGLDTIILTQPVFNIGRRLENDLVIEDPRISREHAQIRLVKGQFVIFDLDSSGGTFVNSIRVTQQPLFPGDVISLAGIPLVYGVDNPTPFSNTGRVEPFNTPEPPGEKQ